MRDEDAARTNLSFPEDALGSPEAVHERTWNQPPLYIPFGHGGSDQARVIAGPIGSGKSRALWDALEHRAALEKDHHAFNVILDTAIPKTRTLRRLVKRDLLPHAGTVDPVEYWRLVWRAALASAASSYADRQAPALEETPVSLLQSLHSFTDENGERLLPDPDLEKTPSPYEEFAAIRDRSAATRLPFFFDPRWDVVERELAKVFEKLEPVHFFLEAVDEAWEDSPPVWLKCLEGLTREVMRIAQTDHPLHRTVSVTLAVRDLVLEEIRQAGRGTAYRHTGQILPLAWPRLQLEHLLASRIERLNESDLLNPAAGAPLARLCGLEIVRVPEWDNAVEPVTDFVLRHASGTPRDLINVGNALLDDARTARRLGRAAISEEDFRRRVTAESQAIGLELLNQAATALKTRLAEEPGDLVVERAVADKLIDWVETFETDHVESADLDMALAKWEDEATRRLLPSVLWRTRIIGVLAEAPDGDDRPTASFYDPRSSRLKLPRTKAYVLNAPVREFADIPASAVPIKM